MMRIAIYERVPSERLEDGTEVIQLRDRATRLTWEPVVVMEYLEKMSSDSVQGEVFDRLMSDARLRKFDAVVIWKLDRFGRTIRELLDNAATLDRVGIRLVVTDTRIDTGHPSQTGNLGMRIFSALAEFERDRRRLRAQAGVAEARRQGKQCGRPPRLFPRELALELRASGLSWRRIGRELGIPPSTLRTALACERKAR
jgi:putative DNA-invertase from lambdoid prophage Rac